MSQGCLDFKREVLLKLDQYRDYVSRTILYTLLAKDVLYTEVEEALFFKKNFIFL